MLRLIFLICFSIFISLVMSAQFADDFSDNNLDENPAWTGNVSDFIVSNGELRLNAPVAGTSAIFAPANLPDSAVWEFYLRLEFAPSTSNLLRIYLQSDKTDLTTANGYFMEIGETGNNDALRFFRADNGAAVLLAAGTIGQVANEPVEFRCRISRTAIGEWLVETDYTGGSNFQTETSFNDFTYHGEPGFFGIQCTYTSTRRDKFFFDDIKVYTITPDTTAPALLGAEPSSDNSVVINFDEPLDSVSATTLSNYDLDGGIGEPEMVIFKNPAKTTLELFFNQSFTNFQAYTLSAANIQDQAFNIAPLQTASFLFFKPEKPALFDVLITEIMADPSPVIGLPDAEYIEIYNRSNKVLSLKNWKFSDNSSQQSLPDTLLNPGRYFIICDDSQAGNFAAFGKTIPLPSFPALTNTGESLTLSDDEGNVIHSVQFSDSWYNDSGKRDGGWSLEMINPDAPCSGGENWSASTNLNGGTPGSINSVFNPAPDNVSPYLLAAFPASSTEILLNFSEGVDFQKAANPQNYLLTPSVSILRSEAQSPLFNMVKLTLTSPLEAGTIYTLTIKNELEDCTGNSFGEENQKLIALPEKMAAGEVVINEVLFNPSTGGADFLELYNRSSKVFNAADLKIANIGTTSTDVKSIFQNQLFFPGDYLTLSEDIENISANYTVARPDLLLETDLPSWSDDTGNVTIYTDDVLAPIIIDSLNYSEDWHNVLLDDKEGVSLERLSAESETQNKNNWNSAAATAGFATPTAKNSQSVGPPVSAIDDYFQIEPTTISPDGDEIDDFLLIRYELDEPDYTANIKIFDAIGRHVKSVAQNLLLGRQGFLRWDGETDQFEKTKTGIYVIWIEIFSPSGTKKLFKKSCVVASKLN